MTERCNKCNSTNISSGSWTPGRCMNCGASDGISVWYYDKDAKPTIREIREKSGFPIGKYKHQK